MIDPHGGRLVDLHIEPGFIPPDLPSLSLDSREASDLEMMGCGALSPLAGSCVPMTMPASWRGCAWPVAWYSAFP